MLHGRVHEFVNQPLDHALEEERHFNIEMALQAAGLPVGLDVEDNLGGDGLVGLGLVGYAAARHLLGERQLALDLILHVEPAAILQSFPAAHAWQLAQVLVEKLRQHLINLFGTGRDRLCITVDV